MNTRSCGEGYGLILLYSNMSILFFFLFLQRVQIFLFVLWGMFFFGVWVWVYESAGSRPVFNSTGEKSRIYFYLPLACLSLHRQEGRARSKCCGSHFWYRVVDSLHKAHTRGKKKEKGSYLTLGLRLAVCTVSLTLSASFSLFLSL